MLVKTAPVRVKEIGTGDAAGTFEAVVSVFGNVDSYGDRVVKGAFTETLAEWQASGNPIPILFAHNSYDPDYNVGHVLEAVETDEGLQVKGLLDVESETGKAKQVHRLLQQKRVTQFSFAYDVLDGSWAVDDGDEAFELRRLKLYEVGPCLIGANDQTRLIGAKHDGDAAARAARSIQSLSAELKAGRTLSSKNEGKLRKAVEALQEVLATVEASDEDGDDTGEDDEKRRRLTPTKTSRLPEAEALERELAQLS